MTGMASNPQTPRVLNRYLMLLTRPATWVGGCALSAGLTIAAALQPLPAPGAACFRTPASTCAWCLRPGWGMQRFDADKLLGLSPEEKTQLPVLSFTPIDNRFFSNRLNTPRPRNTYGPASKPPSWARVAIDDTSAWVSDHSTQIGAGLPLPAAVLTMPSHDVAHAWCGGGPISVRVFWLGAALDAAICTPIVAAASWLVGGWRAEHRRRRKLCGRCAYPITPSGTCPECGSAT